MAKKIEDLKELDALEEVEAPKPPKKQNQEKDPYSKEELAKLSEDKRNEVLRDRARRNAEAPRDLEGLLPSQMTVEEMQDYLKQYKVDFAKNEKPADLRLKVRELRG
jgi:hypothetical protein